MPALSDFTGSGQQLEQRVLAIAGVRWPHQPGAPPGRGVPYLTGRPAAR